MAAPALVHLTGVGKRFGAAQALDGVELALSAGRVVGLVGPNGAGKSTVLKAILGLVQLTSGSVRAPAAGAAAKIGFVLDPPGLDPAHTVRRHLEIVRLTAGASRDQCARLSARCGITGFAAQRIRTLSTGQRQRVAITSALLGDPQVLLLDEPTNGLDPDAIRWLHSIIREQAEKGAAVLVSSHALAELQQVADEVIVLIGGRVRFAGPLTTLLAQRDVETLEEAYFGLSRQPPDQQPPDQQPPGQR
jgi:ABC-2 type transport system ATP-binding protein